MDFSHTTDDFFFLIAHYFIHIQVLLGFLVIWIMLKKSEKPYRDSKLKFHVDDILKDWTPEPLVNESNKKIKYNDLFPRVVDKKIGKYIYVDGIKCLNLSSNNFLGYLENNAAEEYAIKAVKKYGIGSCGPRGFYGTVDTHLQLEEELARFLGVEEAIVYSYGFSTIASAIPAYAKRSDVIFADENVNFAIQKGLDASRSEIIYFQHNNVEHLNDIVETFIKKEAWNKGKSKKMRKFLVVEGIYNKSGDICPLIDLVEIKKKYKMRLFIDESISFGTLGKHGRGVTEYFNVPVKEVDLIMSTMENALATIGGFCAGSSFIVEHQRLSGLGYCFSASLPPLLNIVAIRNLNSLRNNPGLVQDLNKLCEIFHLVLNHSEIICFHFSVKGDVLSPIKHLVPKYDDDIIEKVLDYCHLKDVALCNVPYLNEDRKPCNPSIRISIIQSLEVEDINFVTKTLEGALNSLYRL